MVRLATAGLVVIGLARCALAAPAAGGAAVAEPPAAVPAPAPVAAPLPAAMRKPVIPPIGSGSGGIYPADTDGDRPFGLEGQRDPLAFSKA
jgi:hypothetical protein